MTRFRLILGFAALLGTTVVTPGEAGPPASSLPEMLADAELADVFFLDADRGWAVGDRGVILRTEDGGRHWTVCDSPVNCRLESVSFSDDQHGWAVGGWTHAYTHKSSGVVLRTDNGGRRWTQVAVPTLPKLRWVEFSHPGDGWAIGNASAMYPSGCFHSRDGGRSWQAVPSTLWRAWESAAGLQDHAPLLVGRRRLSWARPGAELEPISLPELGLRSARAARFVTPRQGIVVGDGGLLLSTQDGGASWQAAMTSPTVKEIDFTAIASLGERVWIGGNPGSQVLYSEDGGRQWTWLATGQTASIQALHFVDAQHGWAVGSMGTVLTTRDGGRTWIRQRGYSRAALLALFSEAAAVPLEVIGQQAGDEGFLAAAELIARRDAPYFDIPGLDEAIARPEESRPEDRVHEAISALGGSVGVSAWGFPVPPQEANAEGIVRRWDQAAGSDAVGQLEALIVKRIRQWRPAVIITERPGSPEKEPLAYLVNQIVQAAVPRAAAETAYPEQIHELGLEPWLTPKVFAMTDDSATGTLRVESAQLATRLGKTLAEHGSAARGLVRREWSRPPAAFGFRLLSSELPRELASRHFFAGLTIAGGGVPRRELGNSPVTDLAGLTRAAQTERNLERLLQHAMSREGTPAAWLAQIEELTRDLSPTAAGELLSNLAHQFLRAGQAELAAETFQVLCQRYPQHAASDRALLWLAGFLGSAEVRWGLLEGREPQLNSGFSAAAREVEFAGVSRQAGRFEAPLAGVAAAAVRAPATTARTALTEYLQQHRPALFADPVLRASAAADYRSRGRRREAQHLYQQLGRSPALGIWSRCARGEVWQMDRSGLPPKAAANCRLIRDKPHLDAKLDEPFWEQSEAILLSSVVQDDEFWPASVRLAYDPQYLYLAIECRRNHPAPEMSDQSAGRINDEDLSRSDRLELLLDVDRDYASYYRLIVDDRGRTRDSCFGQTSWNPKWYVAASSQTDHWIIEAAIELPSLVDQAPGTGTVWLMGLQRTVPEVGFQSWTQPAGPDVRPEGFGYLQFQ